MAGTLVTGGFLYHSKRDEEWGLAMAGFVNTNKTNIITNTQWTILNRGTPIPQSLTDLNLSSSRGLLKEMNVKQIYYGFKKMVSGQVIIMLLSKIFLH